MKKIIGRYLCKALGHKWPEHPSVSMYRGITMSVGTNRFDCARCGAFRTEEMKGPQRAKECDWQLRDGQWWIMEDKLWRPLSIFTNTDELANFSREEE